MSDLLLYKIKERITSAGLQKTVNAHTKKCFKILTAALLTILATLITGATPIHALQGTVTQPVTVDVVAGAWENNINTYELSSYKALHYIVVNAFGSVEAVYVDGDLIPAENYTVRDVTPRMLYLSIDLLPSYLETLNLGEHSFDVEFANGEIFSDVFYVIPFAPSTGFFSSVGDFVSGQGMYILGIATAIFACIFFIRKTHFIKSVTRKQWRTITLIAGIVAFSGIAILLHASDHANAAPASPVISLNPSALGYRIIVGGEHTLDFQATITTPAASSSHIHSVVSDNTESRIAINISGGDLGGATQLPSAPNSPLTVHNHSGNASSGHTSSYSLNISVDDATPVGTYVINLTHVVDTAEREYGQFTIDTRMTETLDTNPGHTGGTATTFNIPTSGYVNGASNHAYNWIIDWGDGTPQQPVSGTSSITSAGISHNYATPGEYKITVMPATTATDGWMNAFGFYSNTSGANTQANKNMFKSFDVPFTNLMRSSGSTHRFANIFYGAHNATTPISNLFSLIDTSSATNLSYMFANTFYSYAQNVTGAAIPSGLFNSINTASATNFSRMFDGTFNRYAYVSSSATIPAGLFSTINTSGATDLAYMFNNTFNSYAWWSLSGTIPTNLFSVIDTSGVADLTAMFSHTFDSYAYSSISATIPENLFASLNTSSATNMSFMFNYTFNKYAHNSTGSIPSGLFSTITTPIATNLQYLFANTFANYAYNSTIGTIPSGLFSTINTSAATNLQCMFSGTFDSYAYSSLSGTIPSGLFATIYTSNAINMGSLYFETFDSYAYSSLTGSIPANLFDTFDASSATNLTDIFSFTFNEYAYANTTPTTDINDIWGNANFAGKITPAGASVDFYYAFYHMRSLTGTAQTFIDSKLGGINPTSRTEAFAGTSVTDLGLLHGNWR